ncbi:MAG: glycerate kinase [Lachnospiraceae bacterium]|nr:glycerate kinase [Lachnospiraceae bacterium]MBP5254341.1 glycerate kinase [Lachnospiraceae bacterium]
MSLREDASYIIRQAVGSVLPGPGVSKALQEMQLPEGRLVVVAAGKAAYPMASAALKVLGNRIAEGLVVTVPGGIPAGLPIFTCMEAGHPIPDDRSFRAADTAISMVKSLTEKDAVLLLLSGGASSLFEKPAVPADALARITELLLRSGASITEMNTVRKHLSYIKGGRFALLASPATVHTLVLSDVIGNDISVIGSGPAYPDPSTSDEAIRILEKYRIEVAPEILDVILHETPKTLRNVDVKVIGDVSMLCAGARKACADLGYETVLLTDALSCEAREAGHMFADIAWTYQKVRRSLAFIAGGEPVVHVRGNGKGGRCQEMALSAAIGMENFTGTCFFSIGSDGTDGPTDAAGGIVDESVCAHIRASGLDPVRCLEWNDAYTALREAKSLIITGPTGTNVNDLSVLLIRR